MNVTQGPGKQFLTRLVGLMLIGIVMAFVFSRGYDRMAQGALNQWGKTTDSA